MLLSRNGRRGAMMMRERKFRKKMPVRNESSLIMGELNVTAEHHDARASGTDKKHWQLQPADALM